MNYRNAIQDLNDLKTIATIRTGRQTQRTILHHQRIAIGTAAMQNFDIGHDGVWYLRACSQTQTSTLTHQMYILFVFRFRQNVNNLFKFSTQIESIYDFWHECIWCE